jgi:hypothetical protein
VNARDDELRFCDLGCLRHYARVSAHPRYPLHPSSVDPERVLPVGGVCAATAAWISLGLAGVPRLFGEPRQCAFAAKLTDHQLLFGQAPAPLDATAPFEGSRARTHAAPVNGSERVDLDHSPRRPARRSGSSARLLDVRHSTVRAAVTRDDAPDCPS